MYNLCTKIGVRIKTFREELGLTQEDIADRTGLHPSYIGMIERGVKTASISTLSKVAVALNVQLSYLFEENRVKKETDYLTRETYSLLRDQTHKNKKLILNIVKTVCKEVSKRR